MVGSVGTSRDAEINRTKLVRIVVAVAGAIFVSGVLIMLLTDGGEVAPSSDAGSDPVLLWMLLAPIAVGLGLAVAMARRAPPGPARGPRSVLLRRLWLLLGLAAAYPLVIGIGQLGDSAWYMALKVLLFLAVPAVGFVLLRRGGEAVTMPRVLPRTGWQWWAPLPAVLAWGLLSYVGPLARPIPTTEQYPDPAFVAVAAILTFVTASVGEEIFYRYLLQSHIEAVLGRWCGILLSALLFAGMHLPTHGADEPIWRAVASVVAYQGVMGIFYGYLWARYRNIWTTIALHGAVNGIPVILYFATMS